MKAWKYLYRFVWWRRGLVAVKGGGEGKERWAGKERLAWPERGAGVGGAAWMRGVCRGHQLLLAMPL